MTDDLVGVEILRPSVSQHQWVRSRVSFEFWLWLLSFEQMEKYDIGCGLVAENLPTSKLYDAILERNLRKVVIIILPFITSRTVVDCVE